MKMGYFEKGKWVNDSVRAPFTEDQVISINMYQISGEGHPFTCGKCGAVLKASTHGIDCYECGKWFQTWVHDFMADWSWNNDAGLKIKGQPSFMKKLIDKTKNWGVTQNPDGTQTIKMKLSLEGSVRNVIASCGDDDWGIQEAARFYYLARGAWLRGDLDVVADLFGTLV